MVHDNILDLNLLRSPNNPDPDADMGEHVFTYSFFPHQYDLIRSDVIRESTCLNQKPIIFEGVESNIKMPVRLEGNGLELSVLKKAEKENELILRIVETLGRKSNGCLLLKGVISESDLMEWEKIGEKIHVDKSIKINFKPFEIKTFRFTPDI